MIGQTGIMCLEKKANNAPVIWASNAANDAQYW